MRRLKLHGAFRSGTNYVKALLELNFDVQLVANHGGWKHAPVPALYNRDHGWPIVTVVKDPYAWILSMWRFATAEGAVHIECGTTLSRFIREPIRLTHGQDERVPTYRFANPVDYWNAMAANFLSLGERGHIVGYEEALDRPAISCEAVATRFGLEPKGRTIRVVSRRTRNMVDRHRSSVDDYVLDEKFDRAGYLATNHRRELGWRHTLAVARRLDRSLTDALGY